MFHTRRHSVWVNRRQESEAVCDLHTLPFSRRWGRNARVLALFTEADNSFDQNTVFQIKLSFIKLQFYDIKMLDLK